MDIATQGKIIEDVARDVVSLENQADALEQQAKALRDKAQTARSTLLHTYQRLDDYLLRQTGTTQGPVLPKRFHINELLIDLTDSDGHVEITPLGELKHYLTFAG